MYKIFIMGAGGFGVALAVMSQRFGHSVSVWSPFEQEVEQLRADREHKKLLSGIPISPEIALTTSLETLPEQDLVIVATPSFAVRSTVKRLAEALPVSVPVACVSKGLEADTCLTLSEVMEQELRNPTVMLSGPSHAEEVARGVATTVVAASRSRAAAEAVQDILMNETFRIYVQDDVLGVEYGGALKNIIALAAGVLDGLKSGDNTKAALMTRGLAEIARLGVSRGAKAETFAGLSGIGDLIVTCSSMHSRNRRCGILIGQGVKPAEAVARIGMTVEGYACTKTAYELARRQNIAMPIVEQAYRVLHEELPLDSVVKNLMERPKRHESETIWLLSR